MKTSSTWLALEMLENSSQKEIECDTRFLRLTPNEHSLTVVMAISSPVYQQGV
jgi:hypothetical protein